MRLSARKMTSDDTMRPAAGAASTSEEVDAITCGSAAALRAVLTCPVYSHTVVVHASPVLSLHPKHTWFSRWFALRSSVGRGGADPMAFHAFRRACRFYSLSLPFAAWWSPQGSDDMAARARPLRVQPSRSEYQRARRAQMGGAEVSAGGEYHSCNKMHRLQVEPWS
jgi:hypothetical protein